MRLDRRTSSWDRQRQVQLLLRQLGLSASQHTRIGKPGSDKVISGGERKRLAFAAEVGINSTPNVKTLSHFFK